MKTVYLSIFRVVMAFIDGFLMWLGCQILHIFPDATFAHCAAISVAFQLMLRTGQVLEDMRRDMEKEPEQQPEKATV